MTIVDSGFFDEWDRPKGVFAPVEEKEGEAHEEEDVEED